MTKEEAVAELDEHGFVVLKGALTSDQANALRDRSVVLAAEERAAGSEHVYHDGKSQRVWSLVNKGRIFEQMIQLPQVLELQQHLLGDDCVLSSFTVNLIGPGSPAGNLHADYPVASFPKPLPLGAFYSNTIYVLDDFTQDNGATLMVPGSYKRGYGPDPEKQYEDVVKISADKGDIVIFHGATWHASGANNSERERMILLGYFCRSFIKPQQDNFKLVSPEIVERATPILKRLLGYDCQSGLRA